MYIFTVFQISTADIKITNVLRFQILFLGETLIDDSFINSCMSHSLAINSTLKWNFDKVFSYFVIFKEKNKGLFPLARCDAMRCDFSIELVILCVTVFIHTILRPTSSDVARRRTAIAPGAKNLRIACDEERIPCAHNFVQNCKKGFSGHECTLTCMCSTQNKMAKFYFSTEN